VSGLRSTTATPVRMLVVDDDDRFRERLMRALEDRGLQAQGAGSYSESLEVARAFQPQRALVDLRMPDPSGKSGLHVVRELVRELPAIRVVVLTGYGSIATALEAVRLGAHDYLTKPVDVDRIVAAFEDRPEPVLASAESAQVPSLASVEREHIERVIQDCGGNISKAARLLGVHRRTLQYKLAKFSSSK
jgi:two-component system response regulator RegA